MNDIMLPSAAIIAMKVKLLAPSLFILVNVVYTCLQVITQEIVRYCILSARYN